MRSRRSALLLALAFAAAGCVGAREDAPTGVTIPETMHGRWTTVPGACAASNDAAGLMEVDATTLRLPGARATLTAATERSPTHFRGAFAFAGNDTIRTREQILDLREGGTRLFRRGYGADAQAAPVVYTACD